MVNHVYDYFFTIGLQRTGTKWLSTLIQANMNIEEGEYVWKHLTPLGVYLKYTDPYFSWQRMEWVVEATDYFILAIYKDYNEWYASLEMPLDIGQGGHHPMKDEPSNVDFFDTHDVDPSLPYQQRVDIVYNSWNQWIETIKDRENVYYVSYTDWRKNTDFHLQKVLEKTGATKKNVDWVNINYDVDSPDKSFERPTIYRYEP